MNKKYKKQVVEPDRVPATVEDTIPIQKIFEDGIFLVGRNLWSKTFEFSDVNYEVASKDAKEDMFLQYSAILNANQQIHTILLRSGTDCQYDSALFRKFYCICQ